MRNRVTNKNRFLAVLLSIILSMTSIPGSLVFAENEIPDPDEQQTIMMDDGNGDIENAINFSPSVQFQEENGVEITADMVSFTSIEDGEETTVIFTDNGDGTFSFDPVYANVELSFVVTPPKGSSLTPYKGVVRLKEETQEIAFSFDNKTAPNIETTKIELEYGGKDVSIKDHLEYDLGYDGSFEFEELDNDGSVKINNGELTIIRPGASSLILKANETELFSGEETIISIIVAKKDLGRLGADAVDWDKTSKQYDTTETVQVNGALNKASGIEDGDYVEIRADVIAENANVGTHNSTVSTYKVTSGDEYYEFSLNTETGEGPIVSIEKANAEVYLDDKTVTYGDKQWGQLTKQVIPEEWGNEWIHIRSTDDNNALQQEVAKIDVSDIVECTVKEDGFAPGVIENGISISVHDPEESNFHFIAGKNSNITVLNQTKDNADVWSSLTVDKSLSRNTYVNDNVIWTAPGGQIVFRVDDDLYDQVYFRVGDKDSTNEISVASDAEGTIDGTVQLSNSANESILSDSDPDKDGAQANQIPDGVIQVDKTAPTVVFNDNLGAYTTVDAPDFEDLPMVKFQKTGYRANITVSDNESGVENTNYRLLKIDNQKDAEEKIRAAAMDYELWDALPSDGNVQVPGTNKGYWLILIGTKDNVENATVVASNGIVIDTTEPYITISGIDEQTVYDGDVTVHIESGESGDPTVSGIKKMTVRVKAVAKERVLYQWEDQNSTVDITDLLKNERLETDVVIPANEFNSNKVEITATTEDRSGNVQTATRVIRIDATEPEITVSYDNNNPKNGKYFNTERTMTITYKDRNFDPKQAGFMLSINGEERFVTVDEMSGYGISIVQERQDSEAGRDTSEYTDNRTNTYKFAFGADGKTDADYVVMPRMTDYAGNVCTNIQYKNANPQTMFTIDEINPEVSASFESAGNVLLPGSTSDQTTYVRDPVAGIYQISDRNFTEDGINVRVSGKAADGSVVSVPNSGSWNGTIYKTGLYDTDANYEVIVEYQDLAGNKVVSEPQYFTVDQTSPTGKLFTNYNGNVKESSTLEGQTKFGSFSNTDIRFTHQEKDTTSGIAYVMYHVYKPETHAKNTFDIPKLEELESFVWEEWTGELIIKPDRQAVVFMKVVDKAGNVAYISSKDGVIAEGTVPNQPGIAIQTEEASVYNNDVPFAIHVTDPENGETYSGLKSVAWEILKDGAITQSGNYNSEFSDPSARIQEITKTEMVLAERNNSNNVIIRVTATDYAGNMNIGEKKLSIDTTKPKVSISYDNNQASNGSYFNRSRNMTVRIRERNFEPSKTMVSVSINGSKKKVSIEELTGTGIAVVQKRSDSEEGQQEHTDNRVNTYVFSFGADGKTDADYEIDVTSEDTAGNVSDKVDFGNSVAGDSFTIDEVAPVVEYVFTNSSNNQVEVSNVENAPTYDRVSMNVSIRIKERNHNDDDLNVNVTSKDVEGKSVAGADTSGTWSHLAQTHTFKLNTFTKDANYKLSATYQDLAGNKAVPGEKFFTVDGTPPTGSLITEYGNVRKVSEKLLEKIMFGSFYNQVISVNQTNKDATSGIAGVAYFVQVPGKETRGTWSNPTVSELRNLSWQSWSGPVRIVPNMQAVVFLRITDRAGNVQYLSTADGMIADDVAPAMPEITISSLQEAEVYGADVPIRISVSEQEVGNTYSGLKKVFWTVTKDGEVTQSGNYNDELSDGSARKKSISHEEVVSASKNNSNDVVLTVEAEDYAGNTSRNSKRIAIDITKPKVSISYDNNSPKNGRYFNRERTMTVTFNDRNFDPDQAYFEVVINGNAKTVKAGDLTGTGISLVQSREDSESGRNAKDYTDARTNTYVYRFGANGRTDADYEISAFMVDKAGNRSDGVNYGDSNPQSVFTIDEIAPQLDMSFINGSGNTVNASTDPNNPYYDRQSMTAIVNVIERNFSGDGLHLSASGTNALREAVNAGTSGEWSGSGENHSYRIRTYTNDGIYTIEATFTDLAGNSVSYTRHYFVVDKTAPTGSISLSGEAGDGSVVQSIFRRFVDLVSFRIFTKKSITFSPNSSDVTSGIASISYYLYVPDIEARGTFQGLTESQLANVPWTNWSGPVTISPNRQVIIYARIIDKAGNITYLNAQDGIVADDTFPDEPAITLKYPSGEKRVYDGDVPFTVSVTDPTRGGTYAGLKSVRWSILKDDKVTQSGNFNTEFSDPTARKKSITKDLTADSKQNNSNNVKIIIEAEDYAGNTSKAEKQLSIDITKPAIEITYDKNDPQNNYYYDGTRVATVHIKERNFDPEKVQILAEEQLGAKPIIGRWNGKSTLSDNDEYTCNVTFKDDGNYTLTVKAEDVAGNQAEYEKTDHFVIDTTQPVISVTYDQNNKNGDIYYNKNRTAIVVVKDRNFNEQDFAYKIDGSLAGKEVDTPTPGKWVSKGELHSTMITFEEDADYTFNLVCPDLAGNLSEVFHQSKFVIDKTKPSIQFEGVENKSANRDEVKPLIKYSDINFNETGVKVTVEGFKHEKEEATGEAKADGKSGSFQMADFPHDQSVDDIYTVTAKVTDLAGNTAKESIEFSVNRFGSVYTFSRDTFDFLDKYYKQKPETLTIYETNVDGLVNNGITVGHDGNAVKLNINDDYETSVEKNENQWTVWTYEIKAENFVDEGLYEVKIESVDQAGNRQDNALKDNPIAFAVDQTAPSVVVSGIEDEDRYEETSRDVEITVSDNIAVGETAILVNGEEVERVDAETVQREHGKVAFLLKGADEWQSVEVVSKDMAGNETRTAPISVFVSNNKLRQFYENKPAFYGTIGGVSAGTLAVILLLLAKKRKEQKNGKGKTKELDKPEGDGSDELDS